MLSSQTASFIDVPIIRFLETSDVLRPIMNSSYKHQSVYKDLGEFLAFSSLSRSVSSHIYPFLYGSESVVMIPGDHSKPFLEAYETR